MQPVQESVGGRPGDDVVVLDGLTKRYGARTVVDDLSLTVRRGEVYGFLGPNGAGKTTTLRALLGLIRPTSGSATVLDRPAGSSAVRVGALIEGPGFYPYLSGRDNLRVLARYAGAPPGRVDLVLGTVALTDRAGDRYSTYSLGMKQRLGVAAALLKDPELVILDEPTNGLDPAGITDMRALLRRLSADGCTVVLSSHLLGEVDALCHRVGVMDAGRLVLEEDMTVLRAPTGRVLLRTPDPAAVVAELDGRVVERSGDLVVVRHDDPAALNARLVAAGVRVAELAPERRSLEQVVLELTGHGADRVDTSGNEARR
jgi:ABC-2 type transport system ATP-binding protein